MLLECQYSAQAYGTHRVVGCLTDVTAWHFVNCDFSKSGVMMSTTGSLSVCVPGNDYDSLANTTAQILFQCIEDEFT